MRNYYKDSPVHPPSRKAKKTYKTNSYMDYWGVGNNYF